MNNISGHKIRHTLNFNHLKNDSEHLLNKLKELTHDELIEFKEICDHLVIGLRDRYSGDKDYNGGKKISYFSTDKKKANLNINFDGVKNKLQSISKIFRDYDVQLLLALCTHRHATFSKVEAYPKTLKNIFIALNINLNHGNLLFIKNNMNNAYNNNNMFYQFADKQFFYKDFKKCNFNKLNSKNSIFINCNFNNAVMKKSNFKDSNFYGSVFEDAYLYECNFLNCNFKNCNLEDCNLENVFFENADFENATVDKKWYSYLVDFNIRNFNKIIWI
jgi:uncharacterized protein YjbI with pentapeptide repeats